MVLTRNGVLLVTAALLVSAIDARAQRSGFRDNRPPTASGMPSRFGAQGGQQPGFAEQPGGPRPLLFGFALECTRCQRINRRGGFGGGPLAVWHYDETPRVAAVVEGSPAERAGIRTGDLLRDVEGASLLTDVGAERFSALRAGDTVTLTLERAGKSYNATLALGRMSGFGRGGEFRVPPKPKQFSTRVGTTAVDVESDAPVVSTTDSSGTTTLRIGSTTIRLRPATSKAP